MAVTPRTPEEVQEALRSLPNHATHNRPHVAEGIAQLRRAYGISEAEAPVRINRISQMGVAGPTIA